mmetsp:Transcript_28285/g.76129  ORF Transcript_28285/g.76129 Transcript_28285/m.76129 type:complete len:154 (+) Transcript_28285:37-498(+)
MSAVPPPAFADEIVHLYSLGLQYSSIRRTVLTVSPRWYGFDQSSRSKREGLDVDGYLWRARGFERRAVEEDAVEGPARAHHLERLEPRAPRVRAVVWGAENRFILRQASAAISVEEIVELDGGGSAKAPMTLHRAVARPACKERRRLCPELEI